MANGVTEIVVASVPLTRPGLQGYRGRWLDYPD